MTPAAVQKLLDQAVQELLKTTSSGSQMEKKHGADPTTWPPGHWVNGLNLIAQARADVAELKPSSVLTAAFTEKEA